MGANTTTLLDVSILLFFPVLKHSIKQGLLSSVTISFHSVPTAFIILEICSKLYAFFLLPFTVAFVTSIEILSSDITAMLSVLYAISLNASRVLLLSSFI